MKKFLVRTLILASSTLVAILIIFMLSNVVLKIFFSDKRSTFLDWTVEQTNYDPRYIFWGKPYCLSNCQFEEEKILPEPIAVVYPDSSNKEDISNCYKLLFLGDSFTTSPWMDTGESFPEVFSNQLSKYNSKCIAVMRLSTGGAGSDQELRKFEDVINKIHVNLVIWQFYYNDLYENVEHGPFTVVNNKLENRNNWNNTLFLAGYFNQNIPFLFQTQIGKYLMYLGEKKDLFHAWEINVNDDIQLWSYNKTKISLELKKMHLLSSQNDFQLITTLAPLECEVRKTEDCWNAKNQDTIRQTLLLNSTFIPMDINNNELGPQNKSSVIPISFFENKLEASPVGQRHLSKEGNTYFGELLFTNYKKKFKKN